MWTVPNDPTNEAKIKITSEEDEEITDETDGVFTITSEGIFVENKIKESILEIKKGQVIWNSALWFPWR